MGTQTGRKILSLCYGSPRRSEGAPDGLWEPTNPRKFYAMLVFQIKIDMHMMLMRMMIMTMS